MSIIEELKNRMPDNEDPVEWILATRKRINSSNQEFYDKLLVELYEKIGEEGFRESIETLLRKGALRHERKFMEIFYQSVALGPRLLSGNSLEEAVAEYFRYHEHAESCWRQSCDCFRAGRYHFSSFFSILTLEETGKLSFLWLELLAFQPGQTNGGKAQRRKDPLYHHTKKHVLAACNGALVNSRLDRLVGLDSVKALLNDAESGALEATRQGCLYSDFTSEGPSIPSEKLSRSYACQLAVIAGEIMADVLGNFPWEWERMIEEVKSFERAVGLQADD